MAIWVLVADNSRARFFTAEKPAGPLTETRDLANPEARLHEGDLVSDKTGRDRNPSTGTAHGVGADAPISRTGPTASPSTSATNWTLPARPATSTSSIS